MAKYALPENAPKVKYAESVVEISNLAEVAKDRITLPLISLCFLAPLKEFLIRAGYPPKFVYFLVGTTGARKSTLAALFLSFFGKFSNSELPMSFQITATRFLNNAFSLKDTLTCVDDYKPSTNADKARMNNTAQIIVRSYGDMTGRARCNSQAKNTKTKIPRGLAIMTGEEPPDIKESGAARYIACEIKPGDINLDELSKAQKKAREGVYSTAMRGYIEWLKINLDKREKEFISALQNIFEEMRDTFNEIFAKNEINVHPRIPEAAAQLFIGYSMFLNYFEYLTQNDDSEGSENFLNLKGLSRESVSEVLGNLDYKDSNLNSRDLNSFGSRDLSSNSEDSNLLNRNDPNSHSNPKNPSNQKTFEESEKQKFLKVLLELAKFHEELTKEEKPALKFISVLKALIDSNAVFVEDLTDDFRTEEARPGQAEIGYFDENYYYLQPDVVYNEVCKFCSRQGEVFR